MDIKDKDCRTPGQLINALIKSKGWNQRLLAIVLGVDETGINRLVSDKRPITAELAVIFQDLFGVPAERFLELQKNYDLAKARYTQVPDPARNIRAHLFGGLPVAEMIKRGWLNVDDIRNVSAVESELTRYFGVNMPDEIEILPHAAKKTAVAGNVTPAQLAWLYRVKQISSDLIIPRYSPTSVKKAISKLKELLLSQQEIRKVPRMLMESGIRFVIVESLISAKIDGVCLWLSEKRPVIAMSLRHDRIDNFWFVLRHELEHVLKLHGRSAIMIDTELEETINEAKSVDEQVANQAASDFCVPSKSMNSFIERKAPLFTERDMLGFARSLNIHPGLVVGQLQHRTGRYELFRKYLVKVRSIIAPSSIVDGWGDIAPTAIET
ncbi:XRE family transcriptional regulator [Chloroflexota bacterium]